MSNASSSWIDLFAAGSIVSVCLICMIMGAYTIGYWIGEYFSTPKQIYAKRLSTDGNTETWYLSDSSDRIKRD